LRIYEKIHKSLKLHTSKKPRETKTKPSWLKRLKGNPTSHKRPQRMPTIKNAT
jgi:hypothetical protein